MPALKASRPTTANAEREPRVTDLRAGISCEANLKHLKFQAQFLAARYAMTMPHAAIVVGLIFGEVRP